MASSSLFLILSSILVFFLVSSNAASKPTGFFVSIGKNETTLQYYANIKMAGDSIYSERLLVDLGGEYLWINCNNYKSSSYRPIRCGSNRCKQAKGSGCVGCNGTPKPGCTNNTCGSYGYNPYKNLLYSQGLGEDSITVTETNGLSVSTDDVVPKFAFSCGESTILEGLASDITGSLGLAKTNIAFHKQVTTAFKLPHKFSICLPPVNKYLYGGMFIGGGPAYFPPYKGDLLKSLATTPLITNPLSTAPIYSEGDASDEYFIDVKSIRVGAQFVAFNKSLLSIDKNGVGGTKISTVTPYTVLHTSIYKAVTNEFIKKAAFKKIKRVTSVKPFGACFSSNSIANGKTGPRVPSIDLVLNGNYWRINGHNSLVKAKNGVLCLAFIDGGLATRTSIVLGGYQLEDNLIEFDLDSSKFGFSNSLLALNTTCAQQRVY